MEYTSKTVRSKPGLSQEDALESLQDNENYVPGTRIASFRLRSNRWVAELLVPKTADFPPSDDEGPEPPKEELPSDSSENSDEGSSDSPDGPPSEGGDKKEKGGEKGGEIKALMHLVQSIADALGIAADPAGLGGPDAMGPDGAPAGPPAGGPPHGHGGPPLPGAGPGGSAAKNPGQLPTKLGPNEVLPHQTPIGAPAFASTHQANPMQPGLPIDPALQVAPNAPVPAGNPVLPPQEDPNLVPPNPLLQQQMIQPQQQIAPPVTANIKAASFTATKVDPGQQISIKEAKANLEHIYQGYQVKQIKRSGDSIHALLSIR